MLQSILALIIPYIRNVDSATLTQWILAAIMRWIAPFVYAKWGFTIVAADVAPWAAWAAGGVLLLVSLVSSLWGRAQLVTDPPAATKALVAKSKTV